MALLSDRHHLSVNRLLPGGDMLQTTLPSRAEFEGAAGVLVGAGLAEGDAQWSFRLTPAGGQLRRSVLPSQTGMRQVPGSLRPLLARCTGEQAELTVPAEVYDSAREEYLGRVRRRAERRQRPWWAFRR